MGVALVLGLWQVASALGWVSSFTGSSPVQVWDSAVDLTNRGVLLPALGSTARLFGIGFGLSLVIGLLVGMLIGWYTTVSAFVDPWISLLYASPRIAFIPLIVVWMGIGLRAQVALVVTIAVFPIIVNTAVAVSSLDRDHLRLARSFLATNRDVLRTVALPSSIPTVVVGIRQGMVQGLIGVVVAEYFIGNTGIGGLIFTAGLNLQTAQAFVGAFIFSIAALILTGILRSIENRLDKWRA